MEIHFLLALLNAIIHIRQHHVWLYPTQLSGSTIDPIKLLNGHFQLTVTPWKNIAHTTGKLNKGLNCAFAKSTFTTQNDCPTVIL